MEVGKRSTLAGMSFTVSFTGQRKVEGIVIDSLAQAVARVQRLKPEQFPAAIWQIPDGEDGTGGRLIHKYPARLMASLLPPDSAPGSARPPQRGRSLSPGPPQSSAHPSRV